jgi:hypothetical protein
VRWLLVKSHSSRIQKCIGAIKKIRRHLAGQQGHTVLNFIAYLEFEIKLRSDVIYGESMLTNAKVLAKVPVRAKEYSLFSTK